MRAYSHAEPFTRALARFHIPYQFLGPGQLLRQAEIKISSHILLFFQIFTITSRFSVCYLWIGFI